MDYRLLCNIEPSKLVVGTRQLLRGIIDGEIQCVVIAEDADASIKSKLEDACFCAGIEYSYCPSKSELGKLCGIAVDAAGAGMKAKRN